MDYLVLRSVLLQYTSLSWKGERGERGEGGDENSADRRGGTGREGKGGERDFIDKAYYLTLHTPTLHLQVSIYCIHACLVHAMFSLSGL